MKKSCKTYLSVAAVLAASCVSVSAMANPDIINWDFAYDGHVPAHAFAVGHNYKTGRAFYVCHAKMGHQLRPGIVGLHGCVIHYQGQRVVKQDYKVLTAKNVG